jgi:hypothetical protein
MWLQILFQSSLEELDLVCSDAPGRGDGGGAYGLLVTLL